MTVCTILDHTVDRPTKSRMQKVSTQLDTSGIKGNINRSVLFANY